MAKFYFYIFLFILGALNATSATNFTFNKFAKQPATQSNVTRKAKLAANSSDDLYKYASIPNNYFDEAIEDITDESDDNDESFRKSLCAYNSISHFTVNTLNSGVNINTAATHFFSFALNCTYTSKYKLFCNYRI